MLFCPWDFYSKKEKRHALLLFALLYLISELVVVYGYGLAV